MSYKHFTINDRICIGEYLSKGFSINKIAKLMLRSKSSISDEIKKYSLPILGYIPRIAQEKSMKVRKNSKWIPALNQKLYDYIQEKLLLTWSPEQISNRIKIDFPNEKNMRIAFKTIYNMIYIGDFEIISKKNLRRKGKKVYYRKIRKAGKIIDATPISERPKSIDKRANTGDWEIDTVKGTLGSKPCVGSFADRKSRYYIAVKMIDSTASSFNIAASTKFKEIVKDKVNSFTADNGKEFAKHKELSNIFKSFVYFAKPHSPWERPTNENANGLLREFFPKGTNFTNITQKELDDACNLINNRPRKCLGWKTSSEVFKLEK